jgi:hypothetical protein
MVSAVEHPDLMRARSRRPLLRRAAVALVVLAALTGTVALAVAAPAPGRAAASQSAYALGRVPGPATLATGLVDGLFQNPSAQVRTEWLGRARSLGSTWVRTSVTWSTIAPAKRPARFDPTNPNDPAYNWTALDQAVESAVAAHQTILLQIITAPTWALGPHAPKSAFPGTWRPNPVQLADFGKALATRYDGHFVDRQEGLQPLPLVSYFQIWNEPNLPTYLTPQYTRTAHGLVPASPEFYRTMLNDSYAQIKAVQPHAFILAAGMAPYGDPPGQGQGRMHPVLFMRGMLCLQGAALRRESCPDPAHFNALDLHPYSSTPTVNAVSSLDVSVPNIGRLRRVLAKAQQDRLALPAGPKSIWVTEINWDSNPPDKYSPTTIHEQQRYLSEAFYEFWRQGVSHVFWFLMRDAPHLSLTGSGLYFSNDRAKPSAAAFRFPFVATPNGTHRLLLWGRAPKPGAVTIQYGNGHGWHDLLGVDTNANGIIDVIISQRPHQILRAVQGTVASPGWATG